MVAGSPLPLRCLVQKSVNSACFGMNSTHEVWGVDLIPRVKRSRLSELGRLRLQIGDSRLRLIPQRWRQGCDSSEKILTLLLPAELNHSIVFCAQHRRQIAGSVVIEIEPGLRVCAPGVFHLQKHGTL